MRRGQGPRGVNEIFHFSLRGGGVNTKSTHFMPYHHPRLKMVRNALPNRNSAQPMKWGSIHQFGGKRGAWEDSKIFIFLFLMCSIGLPISSHQVSNDFQHVFNVFLIGSHKFPQDVQHSITFYLISFAQSCILVSQSSPKASQRENFLQCYQVGSKLVFWKCQKFENFCGEGQ
jgi:hypothetical protein